MDVRRLVGRAAFWNERMGPDYRSLAGDPWLSQWCQVCVGGDEARFQQRLAGESIDRERAERMAGAVELAPGAAYPSWWQHLQLACSDRRPCIALRPEHPVPFEELFAPMVGWAQHRLSRSRPRGWARLGARPRSSLMRRLLKEFVDLAGPTVLEEFQLWRAPQLPVALWPTWGERRGLYDSFVQEYLADDLTGLWEEYPVLARLCGTALELFLAWAGEFLARLNRDWDQLQRVFSYPGELLDLRCSLSDPHGGGRSVLALEFVDRTIYYKPRPLALERAWYALEEELDGSRPPAFLLRADYGWMAGLRAAPISEAAGVGRYYRRLGRLLARLHRLGGTDCHHQNLLADGEFPRLLDAETLLHPHVDVLMEAPLEPAVKAAKLRLSASVLQVGLLPRWVLRKESLYDPSGIGAVGQQTTPSYEMVWSNLGRDTIAARVQPVQIESSSALPRWQGQPQPPQAFAEDLERGFREELERLRGVCPTRWQEAWRDLEARVILRPTAIYRSLLTEARQSRRLRDGRSYSFYLDRLALPISNLGSGHRMWLVLAAERDALHRGDVPMFSMRVGGGPLRAEFGSLGIDYAPSLWRQLEDNWKRRDERFQVRLIRTSLRAEVESESGPPLEPAQWNGDRALEMVGAIAEELQDAAVGDHTSVTWLTPLPLGRGDQRQLDVCPADLDHGRAGVALFLAAAAARWKRADWAETARRALRGIGLRWTGGGFGRGLSGRVVAGLLGSALLDDPDLRALALTTASHLEGLNADCDDLMDGRAGLVLGCLALHRAEPQGPYLDWARRAARALPGTTREPSGDPGLAHGSTGPFLAWVRLGRRSGDPECFRAARRLLEWENAQADPEALWPTRQQGQARHLVDWCKGANGIGLARLEVLRPLATHELVLPPDDLRQPAEFDVERALGRVLELGNQGLDHLCCGILGRTELLLEVDRLWGRPDLRALARNWGAGVLARAERNDAFRLVLRNPGGLPQIPLFQGIAGIGWQLLRLHASDRYPALLAVEDGLVRDRSEERVCERLGKFG